MIISFPWQEVQYRLRLEVCVNAISFCVLCDASEKHFTRSFTATGCAEPGLIGDGYGHYKDRARVPNGQS